MITLENKFPLLAVEHGCIISKDADITVAFEVELPELYTANSGNLFSSVVILDVFLMSFLPFVAV